MANNIATLLSPKLLTEVIRTVKGGVPTDMLPAEFFTNTMPVTKDYATFRRVQDQRTTTQLGAYNSASKQLDLVGVQEITVKCLSTYVNTRFNPELYMALQALDSADDATDRGRSLIGEQLDQAAMRINNTVAASVHLALANGTVYWDAKGNLLPSSSGAFSSYDTAIPAGNKGGLNALGTGNIISTNWSDPTADLMGQIAALKRASRILTGRPVKTVLYGKNIAGYLAKNNELNNRIVTLSQKAEVSGSFEAGEVPQGLLGMAWKPVYDAFWTDASGTNQLVYNDDAIIFLPDMEKDVYSMAQGENVVPTKFNYGGPTADAALASLRYERGLFSYAEITSDPVGIKSVSGQTWLPCFKVPSAFFLGNANPN